MIFILFKLPQNFNICIHMIFILGMHKLTNIPIVKVMFGLVWDK